MGLQTSAARASANAELLVLLSTVLGLPKSALRLVLGEASKHKVVEVAGLADDEVARRLTIAAAR